MSNLIDFDLQIEENDEPEEPEPMKSPTKSRITSRLKPERKKKSEPELMEVRSAGRLVIRPRTDLNLPHPPGPAGLGGPVTRLWIKRPPGPAGLV
jgi:hypothetical protein